MYFCCSVTQSCLTLLPHGLQHAIMIICIIILLALKIYMYIQILYVTKKSDFTFQIEKTS